MVASPTGFDKTAISPGGSKWYRYVLSDDGSPSRGAVNVRLRIFRDSGDATTAATVWVDNAYVEIEGTNGITAPDAWMSARNIDSRGDIQTTSSATENFLNYWDVWGVPGDAPALVKTKIDWTTVDAGLDRIYVGKIEDGDLLAADEVHWIDDAAFTTSESGGTWTEVTAGDAIGRTVDRYRRFTDAGSSAGQAELFIDFSTGALARSFAHNPKHIYIIARSSSVLTEFNIRAQIGSIVYHGSTREIVVNQFHVYSLNEHCCIRRFDLTTKRREPSNVHVCCYDKF